MVFIIKSLIINGDDFGLTKSCTLAIIEAFKQGIITSTTICANGEYFEEAVRLIFENNLLNRVGIHINLTEGKPLTKVIAFDSFFCDSSGAFHGKIDRRKMLSKEHKENVFKEISAQCEKLIANKIVITHVDSHRHIHTAPNLIFEFLKVMKKYNLDKLRFTRNIGEIPIIKKQIKNFSNSGLKFMGYKSTEFFGSMEDLKSKVDVNRSLELMVHPDFNTSSDLIDRVNYDDMLNPIGDILEHDRVFLKKYKLCSYYDGV